MFPDIANVLRIREALWRHSPSGNASIMIGSGFSRNAEPATSSARPMPTWPDMAKALCLPLYPVGDDLQRRALEEAGGTSGFLRLAQEFHIAFGATALNDCIRNLVPDTEYRPASLHKRLLRLPWADVFSTNWDTLLERACSDVFDRSYDSFERQKIYRLPRDRESSSCTARSHRTAIVFTEEHYRTFPVAFAPFVNLVQQSMMETIFCLIGFSGDDPNFLHWSGWVRDNLGASAPKIYLVGWLDLSNHRRRMLEARNVNPIDLAALPAAVSWPEEHRHRYAAEWFLTSLEHGRPPASTRWPSTPPKLPVPPTYLGPIPTGHSAQTRTEHIWSDAGPSGADHLQLLNAVDAWAHNRSTYPGWIVAPERVRNTIWTHTRYWLGAFPELDGLSSTERLRAWLTSMAIRTGTVVVSA